MKKIALTIFLIIIMMATNVFAATEATMEIVEDNVCKIDVNEECTFEKKIIESDLKNHQVTLQLKITNNDKVIIPSGELMLVIDSSDSMNEIVDGKTTRKDLVLSSANKLVENLLKANPTSLKIGVVTFSSGNEKNDEGFLITGINADAQKVCNFTNDLSVLTEKIAAIKGTGQYTNLDAGLQLAKSQFSTENSNKYMIILTDGLPNLAVGHNDLVTYNGLTKIISQTKSTFQSLSNVNIITMLTGIDNEEASFRTDGTNIYTYGQVITEVFGNEEKPTNGKFYKVDDSEIEKTITNKVYHDLLPIENYLENITISDYFPKYITDNFDITLHNESNAEKATIKTNSENKQYISWEIGKLSSGESKILKYTISLKDKFDESIISKILDTNEKVDITYKDFDEAEKSKTSNVTPKIKLTAIPQPEVKPEPPKDETVVSKPIPKAGTPTFATLLVLAMGGCTIFFGYKSRKIK